METELYIITNGDGQIFLDEDRVDDISYSNLLTRPGVDLLLARIFHKVPDARPYVYQLKYRADLTPKRGE